MSDDAAPERECAGGPLRIALPVRFADVDHARVVYFPRMLNIVHVAMEEFFARAMGRSYAVVLLEDRVGFPTVHLDCNFRRPLRFGDVARFAVDVLELGNSKVVFRYRVDVGELDERAVDVVQTTVCIDPEAFETRPLPDDYREVLERYLVAQA